MPQTTDSDAVLFPLGPNWSQGYTQTFEYKTDIITSRSNREQRRALRALPRRGIEFTASAERDGLNRLNALLAARQNRNLCLPDLTRTVTLATPLAETAAEFTVADPPPWLVAGIWIVFLRGEAMAAYLVEDVDGEDITLADPLGEGWAAGSKLCRGMTGLLDDDARAQMPVNTVSSFSLSFMANPGTDTIDDAGEAETEFNGREVFTLRPNWSRGLDLTHTLSPERVDFGRGAIRAFRPVDFPAQLRRAEFVGRTAAEGAAIRRFFQRMKGRRGEFYMPSGLNDLPPSGALTGGTSTLTVTGAETAAAYAGSTVYRALCVRLADGTEIYRTVTNVAPSGNNSVVTVGANWAATVQPSDITMVSWMPVWRFASDLLTLEWLSDSVAQAGLAMQSLEDLEVDDV